jgi:hypothetical protein
VKDDDRPLFEKPLDQLLRPLPRREGYDTAGYRDGGGRTPDELVAIAHLQKRLLLTFVLPLLLGIPLAVLMPLVSQGGSGEVGVAVAVVWVVTLLGFTVARLVFLILLALKLFRPISLAWLLALEFTCGFGALVTLLVVNGRATRTLRDHGIRVGLFGAKRADLPKVVE